MPPEIPLLYRTVLAILGFVYFHMKLIIVPLTSMKNCVGILNRDCIESAGCFW